jgi:Tol biopolymer transport system component
MSGDGRFVVFESYASDLVASDANGDADVFVHNLRAGTTKRVSVAENGGEGDDGSYNPTISGNGRFVAFDSDASNLVAGDENDAGDVFVHDRKKRTTRRISVTASGHEANGHSAFPFVSANARFVAFQSDATNLAADDTNGETDVYVRGPLR